MCLRAYRMPDNNSLFVIVLLFGPMSTGVSILNYRGIFEEVNTFEDPNEFLRIIDQSSHPGFKEYPTIHS